MPDGLYERDTLAWAELQADLLRRFAAGERVNQPIDWPHLIDEVFDVGQAQLLSCRSFLRQAMIHLLKLHAWPNSLSRQQWLSEAGRFLDDAADRFTPSMRQRIDLQAEFDKAVRRALAAMDESGTPRNLPATCPFVLDAMLDGDVPALLNDIG